MKDTELRGIVLRFFYDRRHDGGIYVDLGTAPNEPRPNVPEHTLYSIISQLEQHGLLQWHGVVSHVPYAGRGRITAAGVDVVEGAIRAPIAITIDNSRTITVRSSQNVNIGDGNAITVHQELERVIHALNAAPGTPEQKQDAKSRLRAFLSHPLVSTIVGNGLPTLLNSL